MAQNMSGTCLRELPSGASRYPRWRQLFDPWDLERTFTSSPNPRVSNLVNRLRDQVWVML